MDATPNPQPTPMYATRQDLAGMQFAILARMSNESKRRKRKKQREHEPETLPEYETGLDVDTRERQVIRITRAIEARGGKVIDVYDEPHTSAWKRQKITQSDGTVRYEVKRPVYRQALEDLKRGVSKSGERMDGLFAVEIDRVTRDLRDLEDAIDAAFHSGRPILDLTNTLDLLSDNGRTQARISVSFKAGQSADTSRRVRDMHEALQELGIPTGGHRPFGWLDDKRTLHPTEAPALADACRRILAGTKRGTIIAEWNRAGLLTPRGNRWNTTNFTMVLRNPRTCGYRMRVRPRDEHGGGGYPTIVYDPDGNPVIGQWDPIITPEEWTALMDIIGTAPQAGGSNNARKYLATGTLRCGKNDCDSALRARKSTPAQKKPEGHWLYVCPSVAQGGCGGVAVDGPETDEAIKQLVLAKWEREAANRPLTQEPEQWAGQADLDRIKEDIAAAKAARKAGKISAERYYQDLAEYEAEERALIRDRNKFTKKAAKAAKTPVNLRDDWDRLTLAEKRDYVVEALSAVVVLPTGGRRYVPVEERLIPHERREDEE
jgi:site-specific DNA recombinase